MRFLLFIPVLVLFLSNVPFVQRMPMEQALMIMRDSKECGSGSECGRNADYVKASCTPEAADCDTACDSKPVTEDDASNQCQPPETECVCICCFQYVAPFQPLINYTFSISLPETNSGIFIVGHVKDPHVAAPWQPPDMA